MSTLNNLVIQLAQILNQQYNDGQYNYFLQPNNLDNSTSNILLNQSQLFTPYLSRVLTETSLSNINNSNDILSKTSSTIPLKNTQVNLSLPIDNSGFFPSTVNIMDNDTRDDSIDTSIKLNNELINTDLDPLLESSLNKSDTTLSKNQSTADKLKPSKDMTTSVLVTNQLNDNINNVFVANNLNNNFSCNILNSQLTQFNSNNRSSITNWVENTLNQFIDKPDMLVNLMKLGAASIMASYYGNNTNMFTQPCNNADAHNSNNSPNPYFHNFLLSPTQSHNSNSVVNNLHEMSASSSLVFTPIKSPIGETISHNNTSFISQQNMNSDELVFYNFIQQSRKLSAGYKSENKKKNIVVNKQSSTRKSCAGRPRLDRSDWCCNLCRCVETAQWRYLRNNSDQLSECCLSYNGKGKILVCNACYLRVSKENKIKQKLVFNDENYKPNLSDKT